jgi:hypothetical protein
VGDLRTFTFDSDGVATAHYSPFLDDPEFNQLWDHVSKAWFGEWWDLRWRIWILTRCGIQCRALPGSFVEFGVYRGGCSYMVLATAGLESERPYFLFDTYSGIPKEQLTESELEHGLAGELANTSAEYVQAFLADWHSNVVIVEGNIFDTLPKTETGPIAFCHLDLNASQATELALDYVYPRLVAGGMLLLDDYGWAGYEDQREVLDRFFAGKQEELIALPTGQALMIKLPSSI